MVGFFLKKKRGWGNSAIQRYVKPKIFPEPSLSCVYTLRPRFPLRPGGGSPVPPRAAERPGLRSAPLSAPHRAAPPAAAGTGGDLGMKRIHQAGGDWGRGGSYRLLESRHRRMPWLLEDMAGWLVGLILVRGCEKKGKGEGGKGDGEGGAHTLALAYGWSYLHIEILLRFAHCST